MKQRLFSILAGLLLSVTANTSARAAVGDVLASGTCGEGITWTLTENSEEVYDGQKVYPGVTLTITGTGAISGTSYASVPLNNSSSSTSFITEVIIGEGITSIESFGNSYDALRRVSLPSTLTSIPNSAFSQCKALKSIVIPDGVTKIGTGTFAYCDSLRSVLLGKGVTTIGSNAFRNCVSLMTLRMTRYEPTDESNPITAFYNKNDRNIFSGCVSFASIVVPEAGKTRYLQYEREDGATMATEWNANYLTDADGSRIFFYNLIRSDRDTLFAAGTTNEWTAWVDKFSHAAPRGAEVYTVGGIKNRVVKLNRLTATVTLPEDERDGEGDDGVRALVPAFTPVLIKRPSGTLTEDLKMQFVMGGELTPENLWNGFGSLWEKTGRYETGATTFTDVLNVVPDIMASAPYGYQYINYSIYPIGFIPTGRTDKILSYFTGGWFLGNADKTDFEVTSPYLDPSNVYNYFVIDGDQFRRVTEEEADAGLAPQHCALHVASEYLGGDLTSPLSLSVNERTEVTLADGADNTDAIAAAASTTSNRVTLSERTLYTDGDWNTLCLPFGVDFGTNKDFFFSFWGHNDNDAIVMELDTEGTYNSHQTGIDDTDGTLYLYFKRVYAIEAGKPYIVKWEYRQGNSISNPVFYDKAFTSTEPTPVTFPGGQFVGTYNSVPLTAGDKNTLYLGSNNTLRNPKTAVTLGSCRAYFTINDGSEVKDFVLSFDGEDATSIHNSQFIIHNEAGAWYSLDGRKLQGKPTQKGIYIHNGRKMLK